MTLANTATPHKTFSKLILVLVTFLGLSASAANPLPTVNHVDIKNYMGKWYEIASIPQYFQRKCASDTTAEYTLLPDHRVRVYNSCTTADHERIGSEGRAKIVDAQTNAKLKVTFAHLGEKYFYSVGGKYWITYLDNNYDFAIVGHPDRKYGWILARNPNISDLKLQALTTELRAQGYDTCSFLVTPQKNGYTSRGRLCDLFTAEMVEPDRNSY